MTEGLLFANASVKCMENGLVTYDRIIRMLDSSDYREAVKILQEVGYGKGQVIDPICFDELLSQEQDAATELVRSLMPDGYGVEALLLKNDYHNAKVFCKVKYGGLSDWENMLTSYGVYPIDTIKEAVESGNYEKLSPEMTNALSYIDLAFLEARGGSQLIDVTLDKAYFADTMRIITRSRSGENSALMSYFRKKADYTNILTFARLRNCGFEEQAVKDYYVTGGNIPLSLFEELFTLSSEMILEKTKYGDFGVYFSQMFSEKSKVGLSFFEVLSENEMLKVFKADKSNMFSASPICGYYLGKLNEIKVARLILVGLKNGLDKSALRSRLRELYA